ncbi:MAG: pentapeptide repeat-containing protein [Nitrospirales bacterium]|nr:pentapeptide repeat-containing protein [Nitrospirales bacterium]
MKLRGVNYCLLLGLLLALPGLSPINAEACRLLPIPPGSEHVLWVHVEGPCLPGEEEALAVKGADLLGALLQGKRIDLDHVLVVDQVMLDLLPQQALSENPTIPQAVGQRLQEQGVTAARVIPEAVSIRHSRFEKVLATNLVEGALLMLGPVDFTGTVFQQSIDLSKTVFVGPVRFSNARVDFEGFFIGSQFAQGVDFSHVTFGTHSRFHQAQFRDRVIFADAHFTGVAEFLEVEFQQAADFSRSTFASGTGFSGSVFKGAADFSAISAVHEIYFRFTEFRESVTFANARFHTVVDFSNARFDGTHDFSGVEFRTLPELSGSNLPLDVASVQNGRTPYGQVGIFLGLVILVLCYLWFSKGKKSA